MAFDLVPLDNAEFAVIVGCATPGTKFDGAEFNGTEMENGRLDGAVAPNIPGEVDKTGFRRKLEAPEAVGRVVG